MILKMMKWTAFFTIIVFQVKSMAVAGDVVQLGHAAAAADSPIATTTVDPIEKGGDNGDEGPVSCKEAKRKAISACSKGEAMSTVGNAMMPVLSAASAIGEEDTGKVVCNQGDLTKVMGAANAGIGTYCLRKVNSCIDTCTQVEEACSQCGNEQNSCPLGDDEPPVSYKPDECGMTGAAISECEERKQAAIAALAQGGILATVGAMMTNACKDMKDDTKVEAPPQPPNAPSPTDNNSPLSVGVGPLHPNNGPGNFAPIKTTPGTNQAATAPPEDPFAGEDGNDPNLNPLSPYNSGPSSLSGMPTSGLGGPSGGGLPLGESGDTDDNSEEGLLSGNYGSGGEGFLSGGSSRRGGSSSRGGGGYSSSGGSGKKKSLSLNGKDKSRAKRGISQSKSRHQSIFEIMSDLIQSFCREGQPVCE